MVTSLNNWMVDSGASIHICGDIRAFNYYTPMEKGMKIELIGGNLNPLSVIGKGQVILKLASNNILILDDVFYIPNVSPNVISVSSLGKIGIRVLLAFDKIFLIKNNIFMGKGYCYEGIYLLECHEIFNNNIPRVI